MTEREALKKFAEYLKKKYPNSIFTGMVDNVVGVYEELEEIYEPHTLKIDKQYYDAILEGKKKFEIRKNDRDFKVGDTVILKAYNRKRQNVSKTPQKQVTMTVGYYDLPPIKREILYITDYGQKEGYVVFSI